MGNIRIRRFRSAPPEDWEMDLFALSDGRTFGELVHYTRRDIYDWVDKVEPGLFVALDDLLDRIVPEAAIPDEEKRMAIGRLRDEKRAFYYFAAAHKYPSAFPEGEIWSLVDTVFRKRLAEKVKRDETHVA